GHPTEPLLMVAGNADGTGDGVMVEGDEQELAYEYCHRSVPVDFVQLKDLNHDDAGGAFVPQAFAFLAARFAGVPAVSSCALIQPGNSLAPIK
ncbi:MAG TPA: lipase, partial [Mycobacteriales bacterium]|nr:lipase [Mycobacteriales bacterium]